MRCDRLHVSIAQAGNSKLTCIYIARFCTLKGLYSTCHIHPFTGRHVADLLISCPSKAPHAFYAHSLAHTLKHPNTDGTTIGFTLTYRLQ